MSKKGDFLSGFSGGNAQKPLTEQNRVPVKESNPAEGNKTDVRKDKANIAENKKLADKIVAEAEKKENALKPRSAPTGPATRPAQSSSAIIKAPEHVVTRDDKFHKRKMVKYGIIGGVSIAIVALGVFLYIMMTRVEVPSWENRAFEGTGGADMWGVLNSVTVEPRQEYSLTVDEGYIIEQNREPGSRMPRGSVLIVTVSQGPNMSERIDLPEFEQMTRAQIRTWQTDYQVNGVTFNEQSSSEVEANYVIDVEFPGTVDPENFTRNDSVRITVSTGPETVTIGNMLGNNREQINDFIEDNPQITVETEYEAHEVIPRGTVLRQSHAPNTRLEIGDTLTLTLSGGNPVIVPNFADIRRVDAEAMAGGGGSGADGFEGGGEAGAGDSDGGGLNVNVLRRWHGSIPYGRFVSQSVEAGEEIFEAEVVTVIYSKGMPWIERMIDNYANTIEPAIVLINDSGSSITVNINWVDSWQPRGRIISQSHYSQHVALNQNIVFQVSRGNRQPPPGAEPDLGGGGDPGDDGGFE